MLLDKYMKNILDLRKKFIVASLIFARRCDALGGHSGCGLEVISKTPEWH